MQTIKSVAAFFHLLIVHLKKSQYRLLHSFLLYLRSKNYLAMHVILGGGILGISVAIVFLLLNFTQMFVPLHEWTVFTLQQLNDYAFPAASFSYVVAVVLTGLFTCCIGRCFEEEYIYPV